MFPSHSPNTTVIPKLICAPTELTVYCPPFFRSIQALEQEGHLQTDLWSAILACQSELGHVLPIASYLLKPVQRVLKYQLLLQVR